MLALIGLEVVLSFGSNGRINRVSIRLILPWNP